MILIPFCLFSQDIDYSQFSVATTDNFLATKVNPAALGFGNSGGLGYLQHFEADASNYFVNKYALFANTGKLAYCFENIQDTMNIHTLALGDKEPLKNLYSGMSYNWENSDFKRGDWQLSLLYRPFDFVSLGAVGNDLFSENISSKLGLAIRPIFVKGKVWDRVTLSCDFQYEDKNWQKPILGLETELVNGIQFGGSYNAESETFSANISLNFSKIKSGTIFSFDKDKKLENGLCYANISDKSFRNFLKKKKQNNFYNYKLKGTILEQKQSQKFGPFQIISTKGNTISQVLETIKSLKENDKIKGIVFKSGNIGCSLAKYEEIKDALLDFKSDGKKIVYYFDNIGGNMNYALAAAVGDKIYLNPSGLVLLSGFSLSNPYLKSLLDTLGIEFINFQSHEYKTAGNMLTETEMTEAEREMLNYFLDGYYDEMVSMIALRGKKTEDEVKKLIDEGPYLIAENALEAGIVDELIYEDEFEDKLKNEFDDAKIVDKYWTSEFRYDWSDETKPKIAMIYATGNIHSGEGLPGKSIGSKTMAKAIKSAREDKSIKGIILRIDSGGGSAFASDIISREIALCDTGKNAKPVVVSMSGMAASGGYYIASKSDKIVAEPSTLTGSIGVIGLALNLEKLYDKIHINWETLKKGKHADLGNPTRKMTDEEEEIIRNSIEDCYWDFVNNVADGRGMTKEEVHKIAQGRIWTGKQAMELGLVDTLGGMNTAIDVLKDLVKIDEDVNVVVYPKRKPAFFTIKMKDDLPPFMRAKPMSKTLPKEFRSIVEIIEESTKYGDEKILYLMPYKFTEEMK